MEATHEVEPLIELTDRAANAMKASLRKASGRGVRVEIRDGKTGRAYRLSVEDRPKASDRVVESKGVPLYLPPASEEGLPALRIDYVREGARAGFTVQAIGDNGCGCGPDCGCGA